LGPVALMVGRRQLGWFGLGCQDDIDWVKRCMTLEVEGIKEKGRQRRPGGIVLRMICTVWACLKQRVAKRRPGGIVLRMICTVWACLKRMHSLVINVEGESTGLTTG